MDDFERPEAPKLDGEDILQPDDVTPTEEVLSRIEQEKPVVAPQILTPEPLLAQNKAKKKAVLIILAMVLVLVLMVGGVVWLVLRNNNSSTKMDQVSDRNDEVGNITDRDDTVGNIEDNNNTKPDDDKPSNTDMKVENVNNVFQGRLYLLDGSNGAFHKQRYYLLVDNATYGLKEDFLQRKTYVMDLAAVGSSNFIREIDLSKIMMPIVETYISEHRTENCETCSVEYLGFHDPMMIDFEKELIFQAYYHCVMYDGGELSLGNRLYAFNVETNEVQLVGIEKVVPSHLRDML